MNITHIKATTLPDLWFQVIYGLLRGDTPRTVYEITSGSYVGSKRLEYEFVILEVERPWERPLIPEIPEHMSIPSPVESMDYIDKYFMEYLLNPKLEQNETYKYATWIAPGVQRVIEQLKNGPGTNQATISLGGWGPTNDVFNFVDTDDLIDMATGERDPACLRTIDFRLDQSNNLHMFVYFRSWCAMNGLPANLAALELLREYVGMSIGAYNGKIIAASKGLHLYDYAIDVASQRVGGITEELGRLIDSRKSGPK